MMRRGIFEPFERFRATLRDRRGAVLILFALLAPGLLGVVGLATEAGLWFLVRMRAQSASDYGAIAGAVRLSNSQPNQGLSLAAAQAQARDAATEVAGLDGFVAGTTNGMQTTVTVNVPPVAPSGYVTDTTAVQVVVQRRIPRLLSALFLSGDVLVTVSSTSKWVPIAPGGCIMALSGQFAMNGTASVDADSCVVGSNASGTSVQISNNNTVTAKLISATGTCSGCGDGTPYKINQPPLRDPFKSLQSMNYPSSCPGGGSALPTGSTATNPTGTVYWCSNLSISSSLDLDPGTYIFYDASLSMTGSAMLTCSACWAGGPGVTIVMTGSSPNSVGTLSLTGSSAMRLNAPAGGPYAGVVFYRDKLAANDVVKFAGGSGTNIVGGIYTPTSSLTWTGGTSATASDCHAIVAASLSIGGNSTGSIRNCSKLGLLMLGNANYPLVE